MVNLQNKQTKQIKRLNYETGLMYYTTEQNLLWNKYSIIHYLVVVQLQNKYQIMTSYVESYIIIRYGYD